MKFYFAGAESSYGEMLERLEVKNLLFSFFGLKDVGKLVRTFEKLKEKGYSNFLDSGAYSFMVEKKRKKISRFGEELERYVKKYIEFLVEFHKLLDVYVELDIPEVVGTEKVIEWRKEMRDKGLNPLIVWHKKTGLKAFEEMCAENNYVGIGGGVPSRGKKNSEILSYLFSIAIKYKTKVHGFGCSSAEVMLKFPFYSVDSISPIIVGSFGRNAALLSKPPFFLKVHYREDRELYTKLISKKKENLTYSGRFANNVISFKALEEFITKVWNERGVYYGD